MAVLPEFQRQGIGSELIRAALDRASELGGQLIVLVGHPSYYARFVRASSLGIEPPEEMPDEAWMALPLTDEPRDWRGRVR